RCAELLRRRDKFAERHHYHCSAAVHLMKGFLCEDHGDREGARAAWRQGTLAAWIKDAPANWAYFRDRPSRPAIVGDWAMRSMTEDLQDAETGPILDTLLDTFTELSAVRQSQMRQYLRAVPLPPAAIRTTWQSPRGHALARKACFHQVDFAEIVR